MPGRWSDERERGWEQRRSEGGPDDRWDGREDRSFGGGDRVFGERERGVGYNRPMRNTQPAQAAGRHHDDDPPSWQDRDYGGVSPGFREQERGYEADHPRAHGHDQTRGGRFYGDDGRWPIYRETYSYGVDPTRAARGADHRHDVGHGEGQREFEDRAREAGEFVRRTGRRVANWFSDVAGEGAEFDRQEARARGLGPTGYKRSDEGISDDVHRRLTDDPWLDATHIQVAVSSGEVTLGGTVVNRGAKHHAERLVEDLFGVAHVQNNLRVRTDGYGPPPHARSEGDAAIETSATATGTTTRRT